MKEKRPDLRKLALTAFAQAAGHLSGRLLVSRLPRLWTSLVQDDTAEAEWEARGSWREQAGREPLVRLHLRAKADVQLICQRCLEPMEHELLAERDIRFVSDEQQAELLDEHSEDEDVLALVPRLDLIGLIEDELILVLPIVPRHAVCPSGVEALMHAADPPADAEATEVPNPFAALVALRKGPSGA